MPIEVILNSRLVKRNMSLAKLSILKTGEARAVRFSALFGLRPTSPGCREPTPRGVANTLAFW